MKTLALPMLVLALAAFAMPAAACPWSSQKTTEKPKEEVVDPST